MDSENLQPGTFRGVQQIFVYNWHFYAIAVGIDVCAAILLSVFSFPSMLRLSFYLLIVVTTFWAISSLLISHYVYDRSALYRWKWLQALLPGGAGTWANIHAGLDESSEALKCLFPGRARILDIYTKLEMSEPSIERARRQAQPIANTETASPSALPLADEECDTIFLIFVAHELRKGQTRIKFLREVYRGLKPGGQAVLVEHLRDWNNLMAFGPGAFHFFSRESWLAVSRAARFEIVNEVPITRFVRCFVFRKAR